MLNVTHHCETIFRQYPAGIESVTSTVTESHAQPLHDGHHRYNIEIDTWCVTGFADDTTIRTEAVLEKGRMTYRVVTSCGSF